MRPAESAAPSSSLPAVQPLSGRRILVTRMAHQASELSDRLRTLGAIPILIPTIEIAPPKSYRALDEALAGLASFDVVAFTSANGVEAFAQRARLLGIGSAPRRIAAVGPATARALDDAGLRADVLPPIYTADALAQTLAPEAAGKRVLLVLAEDASGTLGSGLEAAGVEVTAVSAYGKRVPESSPAAVRSLFADTDSYPDAIPFTSASTVRNLMALLDAAGLALPAEVPRVSIGPVTSECLRELGIAPRIEAEEATLGSLIDALCEVFTRAIPGERRPAAAAGG